MTCGNAAEFDALAALHPGLGAVMGGEDVDATIARLNADQIGGSGSWSLPVTEGAAAAVPCWHGRKHWLYNLALDLATDTGRKILKRRHTSVEMVLHNAGVVAARADTLTGRRMTASHATLAEIAQRSAESIRKTLYALRDLGYARSLETGRPLTAIEIKAAAAHHGGFQTKAASVWTLTVPPTATATPPAKPLTPRRKSASLGRVAKAAHIAARTAAGQTGRDHLSSRTSVLEGSSDGRNSPTRARAHARRGKNSEKTRKDRQDRPQRSLGVQQAAAELVAACRGIDRGQWARLGPGEYLRLDGWHIGAVADAIIAAGIDTGRYDGYAIKRRLDQHNKDRGLSWPDRIHRPVAFLRRLLTSLDWSGPTFAEPAAVMRARRAWNRADAERRRAETAAKQVTDGIENAGYRAWRAAMDRRNPRLAKKHPPTAPVPAAESLEPGKPLLAWLVTDDAATALSEASAEAAAEAGADRRENELAAAAGNRCLMCEKAPGIVRESTPSKSAVCDNCWHTSGFDALYPEIGSRGARQFETKDRLLTV